MIDLEEYLIPKISERLKNLRLNTTFRQDDIADKKDISRIEKAQNVKSGNFISEVVLNEYVDTFDISPVEVIFGKETEFEEYLFDLFVNLFHLISRRNLEKDMKLYREGAFDDLDIEVQKAVISLANSFAEYNMQYYNFLKTEEIFMDMVDKELDQQYFIGGKVVNLERDWRTKPINEKTVIDIADMEWKMWLMCKEKFSSSYKSEVIDNLFEDFKFTAINQKTKDWISQQFNKVIVPNVVAKLRSNGVFKIGYMVKSLIDEFLDEDLSASFQSTIPVQTVRPKHYELSFANNASYKNLSEEEKTKRTDLVIEATHLFQTGEMINLNPEEIENYERYGIFIKEVPEINITKEVLIDEIINRAIGIRGNNKTPSEKKPTIEQGPIFRTADFKSQEELEAAFEDWYDNTHFTNQHIPGYLTNNSQIVQRLQERLNTDTLESIERFIDTQGNLLQLLKDEEIEKFAK